jgi:hypothetical protein
VIENSRRGGQRVGVAIELEQETRNERSEERGRRRDSQTETAGKSKTTLALRRQGMPIYVEERRKVSNIDTSQRKIQRERF